MDEQVAKEYEELKKQGRIWDERDERYKERTRKIKFPRPDRSIIQQFLDLEDITDTVSNILDTLGVVSMVPASYLSPSMPNRRIVGPAITMRCIPEAKTVTQIILEKRPPWIARPICYLAEPGDVLVIDQGGRLDMGGYGDMACATAKSCGIVGTINHGAMRDIAGIRKLDYPVWCRGITPTSAGFRVEVAELNGSISLGTVPVRPGDIIMADDSGVCVVPIDAIEFVLEKLKAIAADEARQRDLINKNLSPAELQERYKDGRKIIRQDNWSSK
ncbi:RraA family protein [Chloroflexota bacterium]